MFVGLFYMKTLQQKHPLNLTSKEKLTKYAMRITLLFKTKNT